MKVFISQPMGEKTKSTIMAERKRVVEWATKRFGKNIEVIESWVEGKPSWKKLDYLAASIKLMARADLVIFAKGWRDARECRCEHSIAKEYGKWVVEEGEPMKI